MADELIKVSLMRSEAVSGEPITHEYAVSIFHLPMKWGRFGYHYETPIEMRVMHIEFEVPDLSVMLANAHRAGRTAVIREVREWVNERTDIDGLLAFIENDCEPPEEQDWEER